MNKNHIVHYTLLSSIFAFTQLSAAVVSVDSVTYTAPVTADDLDGDGNTDGTTSLLEEDIFLNTITIGGQTYSSFSAPTATFIGGEGTSRGASSSLESDPTPSASVVDTNLLTGVGNVRNGATFQFGSALKASDLIFVIEVSLQTFDNLALQLIDASGDDVGDFELYVPYTTFSSNALPTDSTILPVNVRITGDNDADLTGAAFNISDFNDGASNYSGSTATGFRFTANSALDMREIGLIAIPEPAAYSLAFGSLAIGFVMIRRRKRV